MSIIIRKAIIEDAAKIARVRDDTWRSAYSGLIPASYLNSMNYAASTKQFKQFFSTAGEEAYSIYVAEDEREQVVGFVLGGNNRNQSYAYAGEIFAIYVRKEYERRSIGRKLFTAAVKELNMKGLTSFLVWVLTNNPYRTFYERLGGKVVGNSTFTLDEETVLLTSYGWDHFLVSSTSKSPV